LNKTNIFSVAPMMDWYDMSIKFCARAFASSFAFVPTLACEIACCLGSRAQSKLTGGVAARAAKIALVAPDRRARRAQAIQLGDTQLLQHAQSIVERPLLADATVAEP
jgi:hypothetical protein